jgi:hypothetical protein
MDDACMEFNDLFHQVKPTSLSNFQKRIIEVWAYACRLPPDEVPIHLGSLEMITAEPLPCQALEQISIITQFFEDIHKGRTLIKALCRRRRWGKIGRLVRSGVARIL